MAKSPHLSKTEVDTTVDTHTTGILSNWGYTHTGDKLSDGSHVAKSQHLSITDVGISGDTCTTRIHSIWRYTHTGDEHSDYS